MVDTSSINNSWDNWELEETMPYPVEIGQHSIEWRVTNETADIRILQPYHALFNTPNVIGDSAWDKWVQERSLYYPMNWSDEYETFIRMADPDEEPFDSGILLAEFSERTLLYNTSSSTTKPITKYQEDIESLRT